MEELTTLSCKLQVGCHNLHKGARHTAVAVAGQTGDLLSDLLETPAARMSLAKYQSAD